MVPVRNSEEVWNMQKLVRRCLALFLAALFVVTCSIPVFAANTNTAVQLGVTYQQTDARGMLQLVNDFRASDQAWYWNEDDQTKTDLSGKLQPFTYDYKLEQVAMQRAAESSSITATPGPTTPAAILHIRSRVSATPAQRKTSPSVTQPPRQSLKPGERMPRCTKVRATAAICSPTIGASALPMWSMRV